MFTVGDDLAKTLVKSQKVTFWSQKNGFECFFFLLTVGDALTHPVTKDAKRPKTKVKYNHHFTK